MRICRFTRGAKMTFHRKTYDESVWLPHEFKRTYLGSTISLGTGSFLSSVDKGDTQGHNIPQFHRLLRERKTVLPHTPFVQYICNGTGRQTYSVHNPAGQHIYAVPDEIGVPVDYMVVSSAALSAKLNSLDIDFQKHVQAAAASVYDSFDALTFLAELKQCINMFAGLGQKLIRLMRLKPAGQPWDLWLEGRYGWRVLIRDLEGLDRALRHVKAASPFAKGQSREIDTFVELSTVGSMDEGLTAAINFIDTYTVSVRATAVAKVTVPKFSFNPLVTAWELLRFSFVIDWFFSVGNALKALSVIFLSNQHQASYGYSIKCVRETTLQVLSTEPGYTWDRQLNAGGTAELVERVPSSVSVLPRLQLNLNVEKVIDILALLAQAFTRR